MTTIDRLHERLADLADDAPRAHPGPGLWQRGVRYRRRRRRGTVAILGAASVLVALVLGVAAQRAVPPGDLAPASASPGIPDRVFEPSPWLPGTDDEGPLGRLAVVMTAGRGGWWGFHQGVVGVSATTGEYRFLDLPALAAGTEVALAPDGRRLAYWATGETLGEPRTQDGAAPAAAVAVYDAETGDVERHAVQTEHGVFGESLVWSDPTTVVLEYGQWAVGDGGDPQLQGSGRMVPWRVLRVGEEPAPLGSRYDDASLSGLASGAVVLGSERYRYAVVDPERPRAPGRFRLRYRGMTPLVLSPDSDRVAGVPGGRIPGRVAVAAVTDARPATELARIPGGLRVSDVLAWTDAGHVAALVRSAAPRAEDGERTELVEVDVATGAASPMVDLGETWSADFALDLLSEPTVTAVAPPTPLDPRLVAGLVVFSVLLGGVGVLAWRRRVAA